MGLVADRFSTGTLSLIDHQVISLGLLTVTSGVRFQFIRFGDKAVSSIRSLPSRAHFWEKGHPYRSPLDTASMAEHSGSTVSITLPEVHRARTKDMGGRVGIFSPAAPGRVQNLPLVHCQGTMSVVAAPLLAGPSARVSTSGLMGRITSGSGYTGHAVHPFVFVSTSPPS